MKVKKYYIIYDEKKNINYIYLLFFMAIAEYNPASNRYDIVRYQSINKLAEKINNVCGDKSISASTLRRLLNNNEDYKDFLLFDIKNKEIYINNYIKDKKKFIYITEPEAVFFMQQKDNILFRYYMIHKYKCGYSKNNKHDSTTKQILQELGYSINCNNMISLFSKYNKLLSDNGFLIIEQYRDNIGYIRNIYSIEDIYTFK